MKVYRVKLESVSPYSQSKHYTLDKLDREQPDAYEKRTWRERMHVDEKGEVFIPPMAIKNCLADAAKFMSVKIPGKGNATYTKHFEAGTLIHDPIPLGIKKDDVEGEWLFVPSDGKRGGSKRVSKCFPKISEWQGEVVIYVLDEIITEAVLRDHLVAAGSFIGIGRFRPRNNGFYGRFKVASVVCES